MQFPSVTKMTTNLVSVAAGAALLVLAAPVAGQQPTYPADIPPGGETLSMAHFYPGNLTTTGWFPGKLICLPQEKAALTGGAEKCAENRYFALSMESGALVHPLIPGTKEMHDMLDSEKMLGQEVEVHGKHYSTTGMILADDMRKPGQPGEATE